MKLKKIIAAVAAAALAVSMMAVNASATNWSTATYADSDPTEAVIVSTDENKAVFHGNGNAYAKLLIHLGEVIAPEDFANIRSATWSITYDIPEGTEAGNGLGGGTYFMGKNSTGYWLSPDVYDEDGVGSWGTTTYTITDDAKLMLPTEYENLTADSEIVFMDWSQVEPISNGSITITVSDLKFFDADGNEIAQLPYSGAASSAADTSSSDTSTAPATESAPAADNTTTAATTGNVPAAVMVSVMAVAGAAVVASRKRK